MKVVCETCGSSFPFNIAKNFTECPVCHASFDVGAEDEERVSDNEQLSFGNDVHLGENDSFDEDKIEFWWYEIREPGTIDESDRGSVTKICVQCGHLAGNAPYPVARTKDYILMDLRYHGRCCHCGYEMKNHVLSKRPESWVDPRKRDMWVTNWKNQPKCPVCSSTNIHKISLTNKAASTIAFGVLAAGYVSKTYKCDTCGAKF